MSEKKGFFARLRQGMSKSREQIPAVTEDALQADAPIDEDLYDALLDAMILSDMGAACAEEALEKLRALLPGSAFAAKAAGDREDAEAPHGGTGQNRSEGNSGGHAGSGKARAEMAHGHSHGGRERRGQDHDHRQAGSAFSGLGTHNHSLRGRYLPRRCRRPAASLVGTGPLSHRAPQGRGRSSRRRV